MVGGAGVSSRSDSEDDSVSDRNFRHRFLLRINEMRVALIKSGAVVASKESVDGKYHTLNINNKSQKNENRMSATD